MNSTTKGTSSEVRGTVLDVVRELFETRRQKELLAVIAKLVSRNEELELLLAQLRASKNRGERMSAGQLDLFIDKLRSESKTALAEANEKLETKSKENGGRTELPKPPKQPSTRRPPPANARRVENLISVPKEERPCPECGTERTCIGHSTTEIIDLVPAEIIVRLDKREVLACAHCEGELVRAPIGDKVVEGGAYGSRLVAELVIDKYWDSLPLHRQGQKLERLGLSMPSSSMADQIQWATDLLRPIWRCQIAMTLAATVMHVDATSLPVKDKDSPRGLVLGSLWGYVGDEESAVYLYTTTAKKRAQVQGEIGPAEFLAKRTGFVVADAAGIFDESFERDDLIEVGCNMHARRYFIKALDAGDARAAVAIAAFKALYDVEADARNATIESRLEERQSRSKTVYNELLAWCRTYQPLEPPSSLLSRAINYLINHHVALMRFLEDGRLPIDNGIVERLHRRPAIGRRNYLFAGSHAGAERAAIAYSILATCHLVDVNPAEYLADILPRLARDGLTIRDIHAMTPSAWKAQRISAAAV